MELRLTGVTKQYRDTVAVSDLSFGMQNGVYGLLGANGAGKTTLMRMLCTLCRPTKGQITCDGEDIFEMDMRYRRLLGYLPQEFGFYPDFSPEDYLMYVASLKGLRPAAAKKRVAEMLHQVGLYQVRHKKMKKFSGGMKRRVGIAQAMLNDPKILILDEPTAGLDPNERIRFRNLVSELSKDRLVLLSTHIVSDVEYIARQLLFMKSGKIVHAGTPEEVLAGAKVRAWSCFVSGESMQERIKACRVVNIKTVAGGAQLRVLSEERPYPDAVEQELVLEDVYYNYFGEEAGERDAAL